MKLTAIPEELVQVTVAHPFIFMIRDIETGAHPVCRVHHEPQRVIGELNRQHEMKPRSLLAMGLHSISRISKLRLQSYS